MAHAVEAHPRWCAACPYKHGSISGSLLMCAPTVPTHSILLLAIFTSKMSEHISTKTAASVALPVFTKERPTAEYHQEWAKAARTHFTADQLSLIDGYDPLSLLQYSSATVPGALVANESAGITPAAVAARDEARLRVRIVASTRSNIGSQARRPCSSLSQLRPGLFRFRRHG